MIARGTITILDMADNALYTYYALDENGSGAKIAPFSEATYLGIYTGASLGKQPDPSQDEEDFKDEWGGKTFQELVSSWAEDEWSGWQKYVGEKGDKGDTCREVKLYALSTTSAYPPSEEDSEGKTEPFELLTEWLEENGQVEEADILAFAQNSAYYFSVTEGGTYLQAQAQGGAIAEIPLDEHFNLLSPSGVWKGLPPSKDEAEGLWQWTKTIRYYESGEAEVSYTVTRDGQDAKIYEFETSYQSFKRVLTGSGIEFVPNSLKITVYKNPREAGSKPVNLKEAKLEPTLHFICDKKTIDLTDTSSMYFRKDGSTETRILDLQTFYDSWAKNYEIEEGLTIEDILGDSEETAQFRVGLHRTTAYKDDEPLFKIIEVANGVSSSLAQFNIHATGFNAAVENTSLEFNANGLTLGAGDLTIKKGVYERVVDQEYNPNITYYTPNGQGGYEKAQHNSFLPDVIYYTLSDEEVFKADQQGNLQLKGTIYASGGGEIGGFIIGDKQLESAKGGLILYGEEGKIKANDIELGGGATISSKLTMGTGACLYNPDENNGLVLSSGALQLHRNKIKIGNIIAETTVDENNNLTGGLLYSKRNEVSDYWSIGETKAKFTDVDISGTLNTAVFNTETTQAVGGTMMFMPSYHIISFTGPTGEEAPYIYTVELEGQYATTSAFPSGGHVWLVRDNDYRIGVVTQARQEGELLVLGLGLENQLDLEPLSLINIGLSNKNPLIMGVSSGSNSTADGYIYGRGLTISTYGKPNEPNLFLGDLSSLSASHTGEGYGLYCDNVYLNGSLTTQTNAGKYAGVTTTKGQNATVFDKTKIKDNSKIVFWAGGNSRDGDSNAPFQVTENGSVYAKSALITESLFTNGTIEGATIKTSEIVGSGTGPGLAIYDANDGIWFKSGYGKSAAEQKTLLTISGTSIQMLNRGAIMSTDDGVIATGDIIGVGLIDGGEYSPSNSLSLQMSSEGAPCLKHQGEGESACGFYFEDGETSYRIYNSSSRIMQPRTSWDVNETKFFGSVGFRKGAESANFQYKPVEDGCNLYITN